MLRLKASISLAVALASLTGAVLFRVTDDSDGPVQPVAYDHWQHVTKEEEEGGPKLECTYCHENADKSRYATIPNINTCMACHEGIETDKPEVQKLAAYAERAEQPPWVRVYWFERSANAYFTHKPHIGAGIECITCHGQVPQMHRMRREVEQNMGWCITCHRERKVSNDCYVCHR